MKRLFIITTLLTLLLTACGAAAPTEPAVSAQDATAIAQLVSTQLAQQTESAPTQAPSIQTGTAASALNTKYTDAVSVAEQLLTGTFMLADTNLSLTGEQTAQLIPLWTSLKEAVQNSAAQEQTDAILQQIESTLTAEQVKAIADFRITRQSMMSVLQDKGVTMGGPQGNGSGGPNGSGGGTPPDGKPPAGGSGNGNGTPPQMDETPVAGNPPQGRGNFLLPELIDALIQFLQGTQG